MFHADTEALRRIWPKEPSINNTEDLFRVAVDLGNNGQFTADTHLFKGQPLRLLPYADFDSLSRDASGFKHPGGDAPLAEVITPGQLAFAIKHHRCENRQLNAQAKKKGLKETIKLQDSHIQIAIGVEDRGRGRPGVITLNSPQSYGGEGETPGRFGAADYPMIFVTPTFPSYLPTEYRQAFINNIISMCVAFNAVSKFPGNGVYNGGDPLAASTPELVVEHVKQMILAIAGNAAQKKASKKWFKDPNHLIYCAEYAFLSATAGCLCPLNHQYLDPLVGPTVTKRFINELRSHSEGKESVLSNTNVNRLVKYVKTHVAPADLLPLAEYAPESIKETEKQKLALQPLTPADIVDHAMTVHFDRRNLGESIAPLQAALLLKMQSGFLDMLNLNHPEVNLEHREAVIAQFSEVVSIVGTPHSNYDKFRQRLEPALEKLGKNITVAGATTKQVTLFVPPSLFHVTARKEHHGGLIDLDYLGHGLHLSLLYQER